MTNRILVLGAGGVGGYFGGRLAEAGQDVTFLVRPVRRARLDRDGLRIRSPFGDVTRPVLAVTADEVTEADVVVLTCKAYDLDDAIATIRPAVGPDTTILPLLNGLAHIGRLNAAFGEARVIGGIARIQASVTEDGTIVHHNDWCSLTFGEQTIAMSPRIGRLEASFSGTIGVLAEAVPDVMRRMWEKLVHLSTAAAMTCLMRANIGEIARTPHGADLCVRLLETMAEIAAREGYPVGADFLTTARGILTDPASTYATSMLRDLERGHCTEGNHVLGFMVAAGCRHGISSDTLMAAHTHIKAHEQRTTLTSLTV